MIFIKKQLEIYTLSRPYKMGFMTSVSFCFGARPRFVLVCQFLLQIFILEYDEWSREGAAQVLSVLPKCTSARLSLCQRKFVMLEIGPYEGNRIPDWIREIFACGIWNLGFSNAEYISNSEEFGTTNDWNPESKCYWQRLESSSWNPEFVTWNPESKFVLDSLRARFRTLVYFSFPHFPLPCAWGQKIPPGFYFRTRAWPSQKRKSEVLWTGYRNSSYSFVAGCCFSIVLCVLLSHDSRVSRAPYFGSCVALGYESPIFHRASEILRRAWKSPPVRMVTCWPAQPGILPWGKMWGEGGGHTWIPPIRPSSVIGKTNTNGNLFVKLMIIYRLNKIRKRLSIHTMPCESDRDVRGGIVQS